MADPFYGTQEHKELFCSMFVETHVPFKVSDIRWPELEPAALARLRALPIWTEAVNTELETGLKVRSLGEVEPDPLMAEAIRLNGYEEQRHYELLLGLTKAYGIPVEMRPVPPAVRKPLWEFMRVGYAECFDSFFAFGLFRFAKESGFFPLALVELFEPVMQEEARHILFFANWKAYRRQRTPAWARPAHTFEDGLAASIQALNRLKMAVDVGSSDVDENFMMTAHESFGDISPRQFVETCLSESDRRMSAYDRRLARPRLAPTAARFLLRFLKDPAKTPA
ncbi:MAG: ferritin-like domain-containing protein [Elusimicrobia bacterium]|nr:ferritin-like domain-containing protein [Elusimicrobiota bacterium]